MIERRKFAELGGADHGWLKAKHHFSFASYYDPTRMGWGALRVWNDDEIAAKSGFPPHPHADMEIITYVREGAITHQDSMGNTGRTEAGDVQVMSAGSGVRHSEYNLEDATTRIFQIWIEPTESGGKPSWGAKPFPKADRSGRFVTLASGMDGDAEALADPRRRPRDGRARSRRASASVCRSIRRGMPTWCRPPARSRSAACASTRATVRRSPTSSVRDRRPGRRRSRAGGCRVSRDGGETCWIW